MKYEDIIHRCFRCGFCKLTDDYEDFNCPPHKKYRLESFSPGGRMWLIRARLKGNVQISERYQQILYSCTMCASCVAHCIFPFKEDLVNIFTAARESLVEEGTLPPAVRDYLKSIQTYGNPYKEPSEKRGEWAKGLSVPAYKGQEYLLYIGCVGSYDERAQKIARSVALLLKTLNISFGILGKEETCDGNEVRALGETWLFESLAQKNIEYFQAQNIKKIITLDPHAYNAFVREYKNMGADLEVYHYTQIVAKKIDALVLSPDSCAATVTYHDPCYLGRHNGIYEEPRKILAALPGINFVEMDSSRASALCCGGGGGNFFSDILGGGKESPARIRIAQAQKAGADIIAVACPQCAKMLEDAIKAEDLEDKLKVADIAELIVQRMTEK